MIWLSVNRDFFLSLDPFRWKKLYFSARRIFGGITLDTHLTGNPYEWLIFGLFRMDQIAHLSAAGSGVEVPPSQSAPRSPA